MTPHADDDVPMGKGWWNTASARSRQRFALFALAGWAMLALWAFVDPRGFFADPMGWACALLSPFLLWFLVSQLLRARRDLRSAD